MPALEVRGDEPEMENQMKAGAATYSTYDVQFMEKWGMERPLFGRQT